MWEKKKRNWTIFWKWILYRIVCDFSICIEKEKNIDWALNKFKKKCFSLRVQLIWMRKIMNSDMFRNNKITRKKKQIHSMFHLFVGIQWIVLKRESQLTIVLSGYFQMNIYFLLFIFYSFWSISAFQIVLVKWNKTIER